MTTTTKCQREKDDDVDDAGSRRLHPKCGPSSETRSRRHHLEEEEEEEVEKRQSLSAAT